MLGSRLTKLPLAAGGLVNLSQGAVGGVDLPRAGPCLDAASSLVLVPGYEYSAFTNLLNTHISISASLKEAIRRS